MPDYSETDRSPFQGYALNLLRRRGCIREIVRHLPATALEFYSYPIPHAQERMAGLVTYQVHPLVTSALPELTLMEFGPFWVVLTDEETDAEVTAWVEANPVPILKCDLDLASESNKLSGLTKQGIREHCNHVIDYLADNETGLDLSLIQQMRDRDVQWEPFDLGFSEIGHNVTAPNEIILANLGGRFSGIEPAVARTDEQLVERMLRSADAVVHLNTQIPHSRLFRFSPRMPSLIVTSQSFYRFLKNVNLHGLGAPEVVRIS